MQISQLGKYNAIIIDKRENTARNDKVLNSNFERFVRVTVIFIGVFSELYRYFELALLAVTAPVFWKKYRYPKTGKYRGIPIPNLILRGVQMLISFADPY